MLLYFKLQLRQPFHNIHSLNTHVNDTQQQVQNISGVAYLAVLISFLRVAHDDFCCQSAEQ